MSYAAVISCHRLLKYGVEYYLITDTIRKIFLFFQTNLRVWQSSLALHTYNQPKADYFVASE